MESHNLKKKTNIKEDTDSGLDNASDSSHCDEDALETSSDYEDSLNSDNENNSAVKDEASFVDKKDALNNTILRKPDDLKVLIEDSSTSNNKSDVLIEFNQYESLLDEDYKPVADFYKSLIKSQCETVDFSITSATTIPEWLDIEKFKRGQKFARDHLFCINFAEMVSLFILFAQKASLGPLIFTGKSDSPFTAFKRYLSTVTKLISWYQDDVWSDSECSGKKNLSIVRGMHKSVYQKLTDSSEGVLAEKTTLGDPNRTALWCPLKDLLLDDFRESVPLPQENLEKYLTCKKVWVNQADMSITQFGFVGLAVTYPEYFGIHLASEKDLDAFLHMWRGLGYLLGIKDKYNFCNADLKTVQRRTKFYLEVVAKPAFRNVTCDWEHMCRCLTSGISFYLPQVNFESALLYLCHILQIKTPRLRKRVSFRAYLIFQLHRLVFYLMKYQKVLSWLNVRLFLVIKKAQTAPPEILNKWENKTFSYMDQPGKCPIRGQFGN